ncbi:MAG: 50S ribosome-binding GTPase [Micrococcus sp.]|nr:50S ribosome-binding GTPase [Micrococcus sp.]
MKAQPVTLEDRLDALGQAVDAAEDRLPEAALQRARAVNDAAAHRRQLSAEHTVVGFFGATGSGKSSLFNALTGADLARVAATRPTTAEPLAAVWGVSHHTDSSPTSTALTNAGAGAPETSGGAAALLDWLGVSRRHVLEAAPELDPGTRGWWGLGRRQGADPSGLVLLDLPDIDSVQRSHREVTDRLSQRVDVLVWVVDPEKYADAVLHHDFLSRMSAHADVTLVVLNQVDRLQGPERETVMASLRAMLQQHGLGHVTVLAVSAATTEGLPELGTQLARLAAARLARTQRLAADVGAAAAELENASGEGAPAGVRPEAAERLAKDLATAGGGPAVVRAVESSYRLRSARSTGWPPLRWLTRFRADPLRRLHLLPPRSPGAREDEIAPRDPQLHRTSLPQRSASNNAVVDAAVRGIVTDAAQGASAPWAAALRRAGRRHQDALPDAVDQAIAGAELGAGRGSWWWPVFNVLQWLALVIALGGAGWLGAYALAGYLQFPLPDAPRVEGFPVPTLLLIGGILLGLVLALAAVPMSRVAARARGRAARRAIESRTRQVGERLVVEPLRAEIERHDRFRTAVARARDGGPEPRRRR